MKKTIKYLSVLLALFMSLVLVSCGEESQSENVLRIYNWQDYIDEGLDDDGQKIANSLMEDWVIDYKNRTGKDVEFVYNTFETNEYMMNVLKTGSEHYDLVCPSDYVIQKMIIEGMLEKFDMEGENYKVVTNYNDYGSPFIKEVFSSNKATNKETNETSSWAEYAVPYTWGTMGFVYDMDAVAYEDVSTWNILWNDKYFQQSTAKDSVRDTYVAGVMHVYADELMTLKATYEASSKTQSDKDDYNKKVTEIMNRVDDTTISLVEADLKKMKENFFGFEVDNGKTDIVGGNIKINFAWGGDAVYSMDSADELENSDLKLGYAIPKEGSNIFFDGWVMPKGANTELAQDFLNFLMSPKSAARNMDTFGYTSSIAGDEIFQLIKDWYEDEEGEEVDLSYIFKGTLSEKYLTDGKAIIKVSERGRQFDAQYPQEEDLLRCGVMEDFGTQNEAVLLMWENVKGGDTSVWLWVGLGVIALACAAFFIYKSNSKNVRKKRKMATK